MPSSSNVSRRAAWSGVSPGSTFPPGPLIFPAPKPRFLRMRRIFPSRTMKRRLARTRGSQVVQSVVFNSDSESTSLLLLLILLLMLNQDPNHDHEHEQD